MTEEKQRPNLRLVVSNKAPAKPVRRRPKDAESVDWRSMVETVPEPRNISVPELAREYLEHTISTGRRGIRTLRSWAEGHVPIFFAGVQAREIEPRHLVAYVEAALRSEFAPATVRAYFSHLSQAYELGLRTGAADRNPTRLVPRGTLPNPKARDTMRPAEEVMTMAELRAIVGAGDAIRFHRRLFWTTALLTGMRFGEIAELRFCDLHDRSPLRAILVSRSFDCREEDGVGGRGVVTFTKTDVARRIPVHPILAEYFDQSRAWSSAFLRRDVDENDLVCPFVGSSLDRWHESTALRNWREDLEAVRIESTTSPRRLHSTRHTFISLATELGADPKAIEAMTHTADLRSEGGSCFPAYRHFNWTALCKAILVFDFGGGRRQLGLFD